MNTIPSNQASHTSSPFTTIATIATNTGIRNAAVMTAWRMAQAANRYVRCFVDARNTSGASPTGTSGGRVSTAKKRTSKRRTPSSTLRLERLAHRLHVRRDLAQQRDGFVVDDTTGRRRLRFGRVRSWMGGAAHLRVEEVAHFVEL